MQPKLCIMSGVQMNRLKARKVFRMRDDSAEACYFYVLVAFLTVL